MGTVPIDCGDPDNADSGLLEHFFLKWFNIWHDPKSRFCLSRSHRKEYLSTHTQHC